VAIKIRLWQRRENRFGLSKTRIRLESLKDFGHNEVPSSRFDVPGSMPVLPCNPAIGRRSDVQGFRRPTAVFSRTMSHRSRPLRCRFGSAFPDHKPDTVMKTSILVLALLAFAEGYRDVRAQLIERSEAAIVRANYEQRLSVPVDPRLQGGPRSAEVGRSWALAATVLPIAVGTRLKHEWAGWLALTGVIVGPAAGNLYAEDFARGLGGIALRTGATILFLETFNTCIYCETSPSEDAPAIASVLGFFGSAIWNIVTIRNSVSEYNRKARQRVQLIRWSMASVRRH